MGLLARGFECHRQPTTPWTPALCPGLAGGRARRQVPRMDRVQSRTATPQLAPPQELVRRGMEAGPPLKLKVKGTRWHDIHLAALLLPPPSSPRPRRPRNPRSSARASSHPPCMPSWALGDPRPHPLSRHKIRLPPRLPLLHPPRIPRPHWALPHKVRPSSLPSPSRCSRSPRAFLSTQREEMRPLSLSLHHHHKSHLSHQMCGARPPLTRPSLRSRRPHPTSRPRKCCTRSRNLEGSLPQTPNT